jgi:hypothetical protein
MTLYQTWSDFCQASRAALWNYSPEAVFVIGVMIGVICGLLVALVTYGG